MARPVSEYEALCRIADDVAAITMYLAQMQRRMEQSDAAVRELVADRRRAEVEVRQRMANEWRAEADALGGEA